MGNLFAICRPDNSILSVPLHQSLVQEVNDIFTIQENQFFENREEAEFEGFYTISENEYYYIENAKLVEPLYDILNQNEISLGRIKAKGGDFSNVKAIFSPSTKTNDRILVQLFLSNQYLDPEKRGRFQFTGDQFEKLKEDGFSLSSKLCAVIDGSRINFLSFRSLSSIFDVKEYFHEATMEDIAQFTKKSIFQFENDAKFLDQLTISMKKQIKMISYFKTLDHCGIKQIEESAKKNGIQVTFTPNGKKLVIPKNKNETVVILKLLSESIFTGDLSKNNYETNSRKVIKKN